VLQNYVSEYSEITEVFMQIAVAKILLGHFIFSFLFTASRYVPRIISRSALVWRGETEARC